MIWDSHRAYSLGPLWRECIQLTAVACMEEAGRLVFANGCFDVLHPGHLELLKFAASLRGLAGKLVVGVNSDESVRRLKGPNRPIFPVEFRAELLDSLDFVDDVFVFSDDTPLRLVEDLRPDVIVKGGEYSPSDIVGAHLAEVVLAPMAAGWSTTELIRRAKE